MHEVVVIQDYEVAKWVGVNAWKGPAADVLVNLLFDSEIDNCYVTGINLYAPLAEFSAMVSEQVPGYRMRVSNRKRIVRQFNGKRNVTGQFFVDYYYIDRRVTDGTHDDSKRRLPRRRFEVINLELFKDNLTGDPTESLDCCLSILEVASRRGVRLRATRGTVANQLLKKSPKWDNRYAAPEFINNAARQFLPGNHYSVSHKISVPGNIPPMRHCYYLDQSSAHHRIASQIPIPHPNRIHARGRYHEAINGQPEHWLDARSELAQTMFETHAGLYLLSMTVPSVAISERHLYPAWAEKSGKRFIWVWSPELRMLKRRDMNIEHICCAFTSTEIDDVIPEYAEWSLKEIEGNPHESQYFKSTLLAAYGLLAYNPESTKPVYRYWHGYDRVTGEPVNLPLIGMAVERQMKADSMARLNILNVIARGMIEAETRTRSLEYAYELHLNGFHVAQVYADGLIVETEQLPLWMPEDWRVAHELTNVSIPHVNAFTSNELSKLPGVSFVERGSWQDRRITARRPFIVASPAQKGHWTDIAAAL